jgi:hypothetical protein
MTGCFMFRRTLSGLLPALAAFALLVCGNSATHAAAIAKTAVAQYANPDIQPLSGPAAPHQDLAAGANQWTDDDGPDDIEQAPQFSLLVEFTSSTDWERPGSALPRHDVNLIAQPRGPPST